MSKRKREIKKRKQLAEDVREEESLLTSESAENIEIARDSGRGESESEDIDEDINLDEFDFEDFDALDEPPPPPDQAVIFVPYDEAPTPIGGYAAILGNISYPPIAREAGIEGTVVVQAQIGKDGSPFPRFF